MHYLKKNMKKIVLFIIKRRKVTVWNISLENLHKGQWRFVSPKWILVTTLAPQKDVQKRK